MFAWIKWEELERADLVEDMRAAVEAGQSCPVCHGDGLVQWPASTPYDSPADGLGECPLCGPLVKPLPHRIPAPAPF